MAVPFVRVGGKRRARVTLGLILKRFGEAKIQNLGRSVGRDLDICGLQVAVDDTFVVSRFEPLGDGGEKRDRVLDRHGTALEALRQRLTVDELHDQERLSLGVLEPMERGDIGVVQLSEETGFAPESLEPLLVA